jgi:hypothetical protein
MLLFLLVFNFLISYLNAWGCGKTWNETKYVGNFAHFMNWMGAIMSATGFTWCYTVILAFFGSVIPCIKDAEGVLVPLLNQTQFAGILSLGYLIVIPVVIGVGIIITLQTWRMFFERRTLTNGLLAGYNTLATIYNIGGAISGIPEASGYLSVLFKGEKKLSWIVIILVVMAIAGGVLTTSSIISSTARNTALDKIHKLNLKK